MNHDGSEGQRSGWTFVAWWLAWTAAIVLVGIGLVYLFPGIQLAVLFCAMALFFAFAGYAAGREWGTALRHMRRYLIGFALILILVPTAYDFIESIVLRQGREVLFHLMMYATSVAGLLVGFLLGRALDRRREGRIEPRG